MVAALLLNVVVIVYLLRFSSYLSFSLDHSPVYVNPSLFRDAKQERENVKLQNGDDDLLGGYPVKFHSLNMQSSPIRGLL